MFFNHVFLLYPTITFPFGYATEFSFFSFLFLNSAIDIVIGPNLPIIIKQETINLPIIDNPLVTFNEIPTVPNADTTSNNMSIKLNVLISAISELYICSCIDVSEINNTKTDVIIIKTLIENITITLLTISNDIFFLNTLISFFPNIKLITHNINIASVVVFIPPDVLAGEPPTNI